MAYVAIDPFSEVAVPLQWTVSDGRILQLTYERFVLTRVPMPARRTSSRGRLPRAGHFLGEPCRSFVRHLGSSAPSFCCAHATLKGWGSGSTAICRSSTRTVRWPSFRYRWARTQGVTPADSAVQLTGPCSACPRPIPGAHGFRRSYRLARGGPGPVSSRRARRMHAYRARRT